MAPHLSVGLKKKSDDAFFITIYFFLAIPALKNEVESVLSVIVTAIQGDASQFAQDLMALDSATSQLPE